MTTTRRRILGILGAAPVLAAARPAAAAVVAPPAPSNVWGTIAEGNAFQPVYTRPWWRTGVLADRAPATRRRSEIQPGISRAAAAAACGQRSTLTATLQPRLGGDARRTDQTHTLAQLSGPLFDGRLLTSSAIVALRVRAGRWLLEHDGGPRPWSHDLMPFKDGQIVTATLDVTLTEIETAGHILVTLQPRGGAPVNARFEHVTWFHQYAHWSAGLQTTSARPSTRAQAVFLRDVTVLTRWPTPPFIEREL